MVEAMRQLHAPLPAAGDTFDSQQKIYILYVIDILVNTHIILK